MRHCVPPLAGGWHYSHLIHNLMPHPSVISRATTRGISPSRRLTGLSDWHRRDQRLQTQRYVCDVFVTYFPTSLRNQGRSIQDGSRTRVTLPPASKAVMIAISNETLLERPKGCNDRKWRWDLQRSRIKSRLSGLWFGRGQREGCHTEDKPHNIQSQKNPICLFMVHPNQAALNAAFCGPSAARTIHLSNWKSCIRHLCTNGWTDQQCSMPSKVGHRPGWRQRKNIKWNLFIRPTWSTIRSGSDPFDPGLSSTVVEAIFACSPIENELFICGGRSAPPQANST